MSAEKKLWIAQVALSSLDQWYVTWQMFRSYGDAEVRRRALSCKAHGLVWHDRHLVKGQVVCNG